MPVDKIVELKNVKKIYKLGGKVEVPALRGISLKVKKGEFIAIQGPSGSGKSTAMYLIGCLDVPTSGKIFLEGKDISRLGESELAQIRGRKIGFVFQTFNLIPTLTVLENVVLPMTFQGKSASARHARGVELLKQVSLEHRMRHRPTEISGGESQRVAIARALSNNPDMILADEPTGNLDSKTGKEVIGLLRKLNKEEDKTIVMVTHNPDIAKYAERIICIEDGLIEGADKKRMRISS